MASFEKLFELNDIYTPALFRRLRKSSSGKSPETPKIKTSKIPGPKHKQTHPSPGATPLRTCSLLHGFEQDMVFFSSPLGHLLFPDAIFFPDISITILSNKPP
ncbi:hypothetical protein LB504_000412 [Fusarium proliferatum]|nr:hypothetical protein LB504_000412 [Fusarium proliferatum]